MLSQDELERERYLDRVKAQRDAASLLQAAHFARAEGQEEGQLIGHIQLCQRMLKQPVASKEELLKQSTDELTRLAEELEGQLLLKTNGAG